MSSHKPIVVVGSANLDLVAVAERIPAVGETVIGTDFQIHPGGKGANQAVAVARLGYPVRILGRVGSDSFGAQLRTHLESAGVDATGLIQTHCASGVAVIVVSSTGDNSIVVAPGANARVTPQDIAEHLPVIRDAGMVLTQLEIPLETVEYLASVCARENIPLILDPAPANQLPAAVFQHAEWFTPNESEAAFYTSERNGQSGSPPSAEIADALLSKGCRGVILKQGSRGVYVVGQGIRGVSIPAFAVTAVDTTAAGDAFNGAFAVGLMHGKSPHASASFAAAVAAVSVTRTGAQPSMPTMTEVESFMRHHAAAS